MIWSHDIYSMRKVLYVDDAAMEKIPLRVVELMKGFLVLEGGYCWERRCHRYVVCSMDFETVPEGYSAGELRIFCREGEVDIGNVLTSC